MEGCIWDLKKNIFSVKKHSEQRESHNYESRFLLRISAINQNLHDMVTILSDLVKLRVYFTFIFIYFVPLQD